MDSLPMFHRKAKTDAAERTDAARSERDRAVSFLEKVDDILGSHFSHHEKR